MNSVFVHAGKQGGAMCFLPSSVDSLVGEMCSNSFMHSMDRCLVNTYHVPGFVQGLKEAREA